MGRGHRLAIEGLEARQMLTATLLHARRPTPGGELDYFGRMVAVSADTIVVGDGYVGFRSWGAYVFDAMTGVLLHTLDNPSPTREFIWTIRLRFRATRLCGSYDDHRGKPGNRICIRCDDGGPVCIR